MLNIYWFKLKKYSDLLVFFIVTVKKKRRKKRMPFLVSTY